MTDTHEVRELRWKVKQLGKQVGKQGEKIYDLRCQLSEARSFTTVDRSAVRNLADRHRLALTRINEQNAEIRELQLKVKDLQDKLSGQVRLAQEDILISSGTETPVRSLA